MIDTSPDFARVSALSHELVRLTRSTHALRAQLVAHRPTGVEWSTYVLLFQLVRTGPQRSSALAEAMYLDPSTVSRQVAQLVKLGLAERRADPDDGRACLLVATEAGQRLYADMQDRRDRAFARMVQDWSEQDVRALGELLHRLNDSFDASRPDLVEAMVAIEAAR